MSRPLNETLRQWRIQASLTGRQLADALSWQPSKVSRIEYGRQRPLATEIRALATLCGIANDEADEVIAQLGDFKANRRKAPEPDVTSDTAREMAALIYDHARAIGMKQTEFATLVSCSTKFVNTVFNGQESARASTLDHWARLLGLGFVVRLAGARFVALPESEGGADFSLVKTDKDGKPRCSVHGAMNKVSPPPEAYWRCLGGLDRCPAGCMEST